MPIQNIMNKDKILTSKINVWENGDAETNSTYHIAANPQYYEVQRSNNFEFVISFSDIDSTSTTNSKATITRAPKKLMSSTKDTFSESTAQEVIRLSVTEAFAPHFSQNAIEVRRGNSVVKYAGVATFDSGSIQCIDYIGANTKGMLMAWQNMSYNVATDKVGLASDYKKQAYIIEYSPDRQALRRWHLYGCWISKLGEDNYSADSNDKRKITVDIQYDKALLEPMETLDI